MHKTYELDNCKDVSFLDCNFLCCFASASISDFFERAFDVVGDTVLEEEVEECL